MIRRLLVSFALLLSALGLAGFASPTATSLAEESGNPWWIWLLVILALVAFVVILFWWWKRGHDDEGPALQARTESVEAEPTPEAVSSPGEQLPLAMESGDVQAPVPASGLDTATAPVPLQPPEEEAPPVVAKADDLKRIEGIGPKISSILQAAGITTFGQLAEMEPDAIRAILAEENPNLLRLANPDTWPQQAELAAAGQGDALSQFQDELKGGRRV